MTRYDKIKQFDVKSMASFVTELVNTTEERLLQQLHKQGYNCTIVRPSPELQLMDNLMFLLEEVNNEYDINNT